jgi:alcohol dehydrogenase
MILPDYYEFCCRVKIVAGHDALEKIPDLLADMGAKKPLIITDKGVAAAGLITIVSQALQGRVAASLIADNVPPDSDLKVVIRPKESTLSSPKTRRTSWPSAGLELSSDT